MPTPNPRKCKIIEWTSGKFWLVEETGPDGSYTPLGEWSTVVRKLESYDSLVGALETIRSMTWLHGDSSMIPVHTVADLALAKLGVRIRVRQCPSCGIVEIHGDDDCPNCGWNGETTASDRE